MLKYWSRTKGKRGILRGDTFWEMPGLSNKMEQHEIICAITEGVSAFLSQEMSLFPTPPETHRVKSVRRVKMYFSLLILTVTESQTKQKHLFFSWAARKIWNKRDSEWAFCLFSKARFLAIEASTSCCIQRILWVLPKSVTFPVQHHFTHYFIRSL